MNDGLEQEMQKHEEFLVTIDESLDQLNNLTIAITEVPAPPFKEQKRAKFIQKKFKEIGYHAFIDNIGNVLASAKQTPTKLPVISAHLDTVFSNETISVKREGSKLYAPGIGDDSRGLANLLLIAKILKNTSYEDNVLYVATVGEEGRGDLRGVKHLFTNDEHQDLNIPVFITIDGTGVSRIVDQGIGSRRYRIHFRGPGGHSFGSFGSVNPAYALSKFISQFADSLQTTKDVKTTYSIGVIGGGTSINAIPEHVWADLDLRSEDPEELNNLDRQLQKFVDLSVKSETQERKGEIKADFETVGDRPAGKLTSQWLYNLVEQVHDYLGLEVQYNGSSTDANVPLNLGIPALALASVEKAGRAHSQDEWIDASESGLVCVKRNLLLCLSVCDYLDEEP